MYYYTSYCVLIWSELIKIKDSVLRNWWQIQEHWIQFWVKCVFATLVVNVSDGMYLFLFWMFSIFVFIIFPVKWDHPQYCCAVFTLYGCHSTRTDKVYRAGADQGLDYCLVEKETYSIIIVLLFLTKGNVFLILLI